jgi:TolA-binding protein
VYGGVERIIERRYYVKKSRSALRRDRVTSTSDLKGYGKKNRQLSGVSSATAATTTCSQCSSSTPTYVENLRNQSDTLHNEISELKNEIEHLQTSQEQFFQQLRTQFQLKTNSTTIPQNSGIKIFFLVFSRCLLFM